MKTSERIIRGLPASAGIAVGHAVRAFDPLSISFNSKIESSKAPKEVERFQKSVEKCRKQLERVQDALCRSSSPESSFLVDAHLLILQDRLFVDRIIEKIESESINAEWAIHQVSGELYEAYDRLQDDYLRERRGDLEDIVRRLIHNLRPQTGSSIQKLPRDAIIVGRTILPSNLVELRSHHIAGLVTETGSVLSHTAIVARSLEIPAVMGVADISEISSGDALVVDGDTGRVIHRPDPGTVKEYLRKAREAKKPRPRASRASSRCMTADAVQISLGANINFCEEVRSAVANGSEFIGLYRTEFDFFQDGREPDEDALTAQYSLLLKAAKTMPVTFRTIDVGIDKKNWDGVSPGFGVRGLRYCLENPDVFKTQLRALFAASVHGRPRILLPFVSTIDDLDEAWEIIADVRRDLTRRKQAFDPNVPIGVMIETPAAAQTCDLMAPRVDFFCLGTNDLIQYCLVIDRSDQSMAHLYNPFHPAILRSLHQVYTLLEPTGKPVTVCGEMAAEPLSVAVLLSLGFKSLSVNLAAYVRVKEAIGDMNFGELRDVSAELLKMDKPADIETRLRTLVAIESGSRS